MAKSERSALGMMTSVSDKDWEKGAKRVKDLQICVSSTIELKISPIYITNIPSYMGLTGPY